MRFARSLLLSLIAVVLFNGLALAGVFQTQTITQDFQPDGIVLGKDLNKENAVSLGQAKFKAAVTWVQTTNATPQSAIIAGERSC